MQAGNIGRDDAILDPHLGIGKHVHEALFGFEPEFLHDRRLGEIGIDQQHFAVAFARQRHRQIDRAKGLALVRQRRAHQHAARILRAFGLGGGEHLTLNQAEFLEQRRCAAIGVEQALFAQERADDLVLRSGEAYRRRARLRWFGRRGRCGRRRGFADKIARPAFGRRRRRRLCGARRFDRRIARLASGREFARGILVEARRHARGLDRIEAEHAPRPLEQRALGQRFRRVLRRPFARVLARRFVAFVVRIAGVARHDMGGLVHGHIPLRPPKRPG